LKSTLRGRDVYLSSFPLSEFSLWNAFGVYMLPLMISLGNSPSRPDPISLTPISAFLFKRGVSWVFLLESF
jgi:hypothetical protein